MTRKTKDKEQLIGCVGCIIFIMIIAIIYVIVMWWYFILPIIAIMIIIVYRNKKGKGIDITKLYKKGKRTDITRLYGVKDWKTRMDEFNYKCKQMKIQMIKDNNLDRPRPKPQLIICPNCNMELSIWNKCDLCGWEKEICKQEALGKKCFLKIDENSCKNCGKYERWDGEEQEKEKRSRHISQRVKREVWRRDFGKCVECGSKERLEYDHIIPFSKGGSNTTRNIQLLCEDCNRKKYNNI